MAIKPTIYKLNIALSDLDRNHYDALNLTIALHPSETVERMMVRVLSYCINATAQLAFTRGLSAIEEPDLWARTLDGQISLWIDVGEPSIDRIKKAARLAEEVRIYSFNQTDSFASVCLSIRLGINTVPGFVSATHNENVGDHYRRICVCCRRIRRVRGILG